MKRIQFIIYATILSFIISSCKKFIALDPPRTELVTTTVFENDATANAAMVDVYYGLSRAGFLSGATVSLSLFASYSSDEQENYAQITEFQQFEENELTADNSLILGLWNDIYKTIYKTNAIIEGGSNSTGLSAGLKAQLLGEAKCIRAFCHFYLVNLFGDIPLITKTDYQANAAQPRTPKSEVYQQIIADLKDAQNLLPADYSFAGNQRVRVNKWAATAMLSRAYLYIEDWVNAEIETSKIIQNTSLFSLASDLDLVFRKTSPEAIWQFHTDVLVNDYYTFQVSTG